MVTSTDEYIDALSIPTWMLFTDVSYIAQCFKMAITVIELKDTGDKFVNFDNLRVFRYGKEFKRNVFIR